MGQLEQIPGYSAIKTDVNFIFKTDKAPVDMRRASTFFKTDRAPVDMPILTVNFFFKTDKARVGRPS